MNTIKKIYLAFFIQLLLFSAAHAQATRTWVSGVGDDANPCSRTAPCKTFAGAISKTAANGEINALDPGGFGGVTITKSITISSESFEAGVLVSGTSGITINGAGIVVNLRGLDIEGLGGGLNGIRILSAATVSVENCTINNFTQKGIDASNSTGLRLFVKDTIIRNQVGANSAGIGITPGVGAVTTVNLNRVTIQGNRQGIVQNSLSSLTIVNSLITGSIAEGLSLVAPSGSAFTSVIGSSFTNNGASALKADGAGSQVALTGSTLINNITGVTKVNGGQINSFGNNTLFGNSTNGTFNGTIPLQ